MQDPYLIPCIQFRQFISYKILHYKQQLQIQNFMQEFPYEGNITKKININEQKFIYIIKDGNQQFAVKQIVQNEKTMIEYNIAKQILYPNFQHTNIVRIYDARIQNDKIYIKMELGQDQRDTLNLIGSNFDIQEILKLMLHVAQGLYTLNSLNIIHRDIKPQNIIYAEGFYKLIDFGISKHLSGISKSASTKCGTKPYMAPQVFLSNLQNYTAKCDIWSLGATIYFLLYRTYVFRDEDQKLFFQEFGQSPYQIVYYRKYEEINFFLRGMLVYNDADRWSVEVLLKNIQGQRISQQINSAVIDEQQLSDLVQIDPQSDPQLQAALYKIKISVIKKLIEIQDNSGSPREVQSLKHAMRDYINNWCKFQNQLSPEEQQKVRHIDFIKVVKKENERIYNELKQFLN